MAMLLRVGFFVAASLVACLLSTPPIAEPLDRSAVENPFVAPARPLERRFDEWRRALRLTGEQEKLFQAMERHLQHVSEERDAAVVAAAIDRNREPISRDPGAPLRARAERLSRHADSLRALADAESSFFSSLSEEQRRIAEDIVPKDVLNLRDVFRRRGVRPDKNG